MEKKETIAGTMAAFMATSPSVKDYPSYKSLNDFVGNLHGLPAGKVQALAGEKAWCWYPDQVTGKWRPATEEEIQACRDKAAGKNHGGPRSKVLSDEERVTLDTQIAALEAVNNPALVDLVAALKTKQEYDDYARRGTLKDRLQACIDTLGLAEVVALLEGAVESV